MRHEEAASLLRRVWIGRPQKRKTGREYALFTRMARDWRDSSGNVKMKTASAGLKTLKQCSPALRFD
jgi:hypothetical protein